MVIDFPINILEKSRTPNNAYNGNYQQKLVTACVRNRYSKTHELSNTY